MSKKRLLGFIGHVCLIGTFMLFGLRYAYAQDRTITGTVSDEKGGPLNGATVKIKGTSSGVTTDVSGHFSLVVPAKASRASRLEISYVGFETQEVALHGGASLQVTLQATKSSLDEVVVVGYGVQKRKDVTGSVSSVKGSAIKNQPVTNVTEALQGRAAGVEVIKNSGQPDAQPTIIIRGISSLHQPGPLYIVDGVRVPGDNINIQDIATIDILKDASAAAVYGSAAAGGVIIITTKKGAGLKPVINLNARYGVTTPKLVHLLDKNDFIKLYNITHPTFFAGATHTDTLANTDWVKALYGNASEQNYNLSVSGSGNVMDYLFSGFYNAQKGIYIKNYSNIAGTRINTNYKLADFLKIGEEVAVSQRRTAPLVGTEAQLHNAPFRTQPIIPIMRKDGSWGVVPPGYNGLAFGGPNPVGSAASADAQNYRNNLQANVYAEVKLPLHLSFRTNFGYSYYLETQDYFQNSFNFGSVTNTNNSLNKYYIESTQLLSNYVLTYDQHFGKHAINAVAGYEQIKNTYNTVNTLMTSVGLADYSFIQTSQSSISASGNYDNNGLIKSLFGKLYYNYDNRYYISGTIRQDANFTVFGPDRQRGVFGAASAGWNISDEAFFKPLTSVVNLLKLRGSYGSLGNSNLLAYTYAATYSKFLGSSGLGSLAGANFAPGAPLLIGNAINSIPNPNLHWETVYETNIGLDGEALKGKLYFSVDWYNKTTRDVLYALPLSLSSGFTVPYFTNIGEVSSKGVDIMLGYRSKIGELGYDVSVNAGFNRNKVVDLDGITTDALYDGYNYYNNGNSGYGIMANQTLTITKAGLPFGSFYGYKVLGLFKTDAEAAAATAQPGARAGDLHFAHDPKNGPTLNLQDRQVIGNPNPKLVYGINIRLNYKAFDASLLFNGVAGVQLFNGVKAYEQYPFADGNTTSKVFGDSYLGANGLTAQPRLGIVNPDGSFNLDPNKNYTSVNSYFVESGAYLKLKNLQVGYTFSGGVLNRIAVKNARLFVMANNLFTITHYSGLDPEVGSAFSQASMNGFVGTTVGVTTRGLDAVSQYPQTRIYSAGIDFNF